MHRIEAYTRLAIIFIIIITILYLSILLILRKNGIHLEIQITHKIIQKQIIIPQKAMMI